MARELPLFPLSLVVFPGEKLNLHIFENRYRQMITDCLASHAPFGIVPYLDGSMRELGTVMQVTRVEKTYATGEMDICTQGIALFRIRKFFKQAKDKLYPAGHIELLPDDPLPDTHLHQRLETLVKQLYQALGLHKLYLDLSPDFRTYDIAHHVGFSPEQEYEFLGASSEHHRQEILLEHLEHILPIVLETERLKERTKLNGHFKNFSPPEF